MTFGLIVARIPEAGLADAPDDALDAALGLPRRAVGAQAPSIASMARWMATNWPLSERSSLRSASRIPLLDIVTCTSRASSAAARRPPKCASSHHRPLPRPTGPLPIQRAGFGRRGAGPLEVVDRRTHLGRVRCRPVVAAGQPRYSRPPAPHDSGHRRLFRNRTARTDLGPFVTRARDAMDELWGAVSIDTAPPLLLTHAPLTEVPAGHVNVHGHLHDQWYLPVTRHINATVEQLDYRPATLEEVLALAKEVVKERSRASGPQQARCGNLGTEREWKQRAVQRTIEIDRDLDGGVSETPVTPGEWVTTAGQWLDEASARGESEAIACWRSASSTGAPAGAPRGP